jgi:hypothetical protein
VRRLLVHDCCRARFLVLAQDSLQVSRPTASFGALTMPQEGRVPRPERPYHASFRVGRGAARSWRASR